MTFYDDEENSQVFPEDPLFDAAEEFPKSMTKNNIGVHETHCCVLHGCKYGLDDKDCPVTNGTVKQKYICEDCDISSIKSINDLNKVVEGKFHKCPSCGYMF